MRDDETLSRLDDVAPWKHLNRLSVGAFSETTKSDVEAYALNSSSILKKIVFHLKKCSFRFQHCNPSHVSSTTSREPGVARENMGTLNISEP